MYFHLFSPLIYFLFVRCILQIAPIPKSKIMLFLRKYHNISLSILSFIMLIGITIGNYQTGKLTSINNLLCKSYQNNWYAKTSCKLFLYSKYLEWADTLYLHLSGKKISMLQYTHHMTTALLTFANIYDYISPFTFIFMSINCLVHIFMYWYFAFPKGFLRSFRKTITQSQIIQHAVCIITIMYTYRLDNCQQNKYVLQLALILYSMYLFYFCVFYLKTYLKKNN